MIVTMTQQFAGMASKRAVAVAVVGLTTAHSFGQPIWAWPAAAASDHTITLVSADGSTVPPAPVPEVVPSEQPSDYESDPDADAPPEPVPVTEQAPTPVPPTAASPVHAAPLPPLPMPATSVHSQAGRAVAAYPCPPCQPKPRHQCCLEDELDRRCIYGVAPLGMSLRTTFGAQVAKADATQQVLYEYDFVTGHESLTTRGQYWLMKIVTLANQSPFPIIVQALPRNPELAEARRTEVIRQLEMAGWSGFDERVVIGLPLTPGLHGLDALPIAERLPYLSIGAGTIGASGPSQGAPAIPIGQ